MSRGVVNNISCLDKLLYNKQDEAWLILYILSIYNKVLQ